MRSILLVLVLAVFSGVAPLQADELGESGELMSGPVKLHYVTAGQGPLLVLLHGFPDFHYTWRDQMPALSQHFQVVALDLRGFNTSDQPTGVENYTMEKLVGDVAAVLTHFKQEKMVLVGHDWGGAIAWSFAMTYPDKVDRLIILNLPHPIGFTRELASNLDQQKASQYARDLQQPLAAQFLKPDQLVSWVQEPEARAIYLDALKRSSMEGMLNYYKANFPRPPYKAVTALPPVKCPVLMIHGLDDQALLPAALNDTWKWLENDLTLITVPGAGHFVHRDQPELVTRKMRTWLLER